MSKIGVQPITIPAGISFKLENKQITLSNSNGQLSLSLPQNIEVKQEADKLIVTRNSESKQAKSNHGSTRAHLANMVAGLQTPFVKNLEIRGTGYKFTLSGNKLTVLAGFIHPVIIEAKPGITFQVPEETKLTISGSNIVLVGQTASTIRKIRPPEVYKGKGIRYVNEFIKLKPGKAAKAGA